MSHEEFPTDGPAVVTCGLPYANGDLHIGHLRGYTAADAVNRSLKKLGQQSAYVCGSDMHGTPVALNSAKEGVSPEEYAMEYHEKYAETFPKFNVEFDNYGHTHDETNTEITREFVEKLEAAGYVYEDEILVAWDPEEDQPLPDRYVEGTCPYCGEQARGDECDEGCGRHLEPGEIEDPVSTLTGNPAEYREREHKYFAVSELADYLSEFLDRVEGTSNARNQPREWIEEGLKDWCITRDMDWGIDYPGEEDLVLYVWVDAPIEYVSSTKQYSERVGADEYDWEEVWGRDGGDGGEIVHVIGRDIIQHHTIFWPAMLHATDHAEPRSVCATGFVTIDGKGLSTSRNRAIWAEEYLDEGFHPDLLRYYLTTMGGFQQDLDFTWERFQERVNGELVGTVGNFVYRSMLFAARNFDGTPDADVSDEVRARIDDAVEQFEAAVRDYDVRNAGDAAVELAQFGNEYIQQHEPWQLEDGSDEQAQVIRDCLQVATAVAVLLEPTCPGKAETVWAQLGIDADVHAAETDAVHTEPGAFDEPDELFEKIEDDRVDELDAALEEKIAEATADDEDETEDPEMDESDLEPLIDERIDFDTFESLDIRVGRIESAEGVEGADKLVRLSVDIGVETRQIVAGLKQLHDVEELAGEKVIVLANLEKAELFGVESNGMVLAAGDQADLLTTKEDAEPGTKVL
ncbi:MULTISPECIES: methionine--tRNA ligase [Halolamina]|uniref:Methionine--tRNA ligase n=1 Tax=Halolamina pelagica TaxID=699431 RepID=A0A1I5QCH4_9EURY|nr:MULTISPECIES: methionine--tRNA ligase [Halolamina]NHX35193.1 methionine--tRNA ligase [Halolamina sp. R1-12]SFP43741.1 methionyl-tRNA synthetase [Halolamina pelagica]